MRFELKNLEVMSIAIQEGVAQKTGNPWKKAEIVFKEEVSGYTSEMVASLFGMEDVEDFTTHVKKGDRVDVSFRISAREWNGRKYNDISVISFTPLKKAQAYVDNNNLPDYLQPPHCDDLPMGF